MGTPSPTDRAPRPLRRKVLIAIALALALSAAWCLGYEPRYQGSLVTKPSRTLVFGHRGFGDHAPDNSLYAVEKALDAGFDGVDVDGQLTSDGELVIFHDLSVDRLTSDTGHVRDKTLAQMLALDLGPKADSAMTGAYVHTFEDVVKAVKGRGILMVELKVPGSAATGIERRAVEIIQKHDARADVVLSSFNPLVLYRLKKLDPQVRTALIFMDTNWNPQLIAEIKPGDVVDLPWALRQEFIRRAVRKVVRPDLLSINHEVDEAVINRLIAKGWPAFIWTPDDEASIRRALRDAAVRRNLGRARARAPAAGPVIDPLALAPGSGMNLFGVTIHEPDVALTDVGLQCWAVTLGGDCGRGGRGMLERHGAIIMAGLASAAFWGAIFHGFFPAHTATPPGFVIWMLVALSIVVVAATLIDLGLRILVPGLTPSLRSAIVGIYAFSFATVVVLVDESFTSIVRFYGPALVLVLIAAAGQAVRGGSAGWRLIAIGFAVSIGAALLQQAHVGLDPVYFNHNAVYHVLQGIALVLLYLGFRRAQPVASRVQG